MSAPAGPSPLRRYQLEPFAAILRVAEEHDSGIVTVTMPRQTGKNEVSARVEGALMTPAIAAGGKGVKAAPTADPQVKRSVDRLASFFRACGFRPPLLRAGGNEVALGEAVWWYGSGEPDANVVGATAGLLLEIDEAQDFDQEKYDKDYAPMAASTAAARVFYGTPWSDFDLLAKMEELAAARGQAFRVTWERVAEELPAYGRHVEAERVRLGHTDATPHPAFLTQYLLGRVSGAGRFFTPAQLDLLQGAHARQEGPGTASHNVYVAGVDVGGANLSAAMDPDETVVTIARARYPGRGRSADPPLLELVDQVAWRGRDHDDARGEVFRILMRWGVTHVAVDATGIGEPLATWLLGRPELGPRKVTAVKFTGESKSQLGYDLLAAVNTGGFKVWRTEGYDADRDELLRQARLCKRELTPQGKLRWFVDGKDGHDDRLVSAGLVLRAADRGRPRVATMRGPS